MQTNYLDDRPPLFTDNMSAEDVIEKTKQNLADPTVESFEVYLNRHDRRAQNAMHKRKPDPPKKKRKN